MNVKPMTHQEVFAQKKRLEIPVFYNNSINASLTYKVRSQNLTFWRYILDRFFVVVFLLQKLVSVSSALIYRYVQQYLFSLSYCPMFIG